MARGEPHVVVVHHRDYLHTVAMVIGPFPNYTSAHKFAADRRREKKEDNVKYIYTVRKIVDSINVV